MQSKTLAEQLVNANISSILELMRIIKKETKSGYTQFNMTDLVKGTMDIHTYVKQNFTTAILECKYIRKHGAGRFTTWHWLVDEPTVNMATKIFESCIRIGKSKTAPKHDIVKSNFVPLLNGTKSAGTIIKQFEIDLNVIKAKTMDGEILPVDNDLIKPEVIQGLHQLGYIEYKAANRAFTWIGGDVNLDLANLLASDSKISIVLGLKKGPNRPPNSLNMERKARSTNEQFVNRLTFMCQEFFNSHKEFSISALNKINPENTVPWYYLSYIKAMVKNKQWIGPTPSNDLSVKIIDAYKNGINAENFLQNFETEIVTTPPVVEETVTPELPELTPEPVYKNTTSNVKDQKQAMLKILQDEILQDDVINQEFKILLTNMDAIDSLRASMNILKKSMQPTMSKLGAINAKVNYYLLLRKEQEGNE